jgi:5-(carboxyamino)imidazole ribonucleotide synthase
MNQSGKPDRQRIGILGGGQLGRMMGLAGIPLGFEFVFLDPAADACAASTGALRQAEFSDVEAARAFAREVDMATFDFENVPADSARAVAESRPFHPCVEALGSCQDRVSEKSLLTELEIPVPEFRVVGSRPDLLAAVEDLGFPSVLKTRRLGYDGKGQAILRQHEDLELAWQRLGGSALILERFIPFEAECSLVSVRAHSREIRYWPLTRNVHENGVLKLSLPGVFESGLQERAQEIAARLLEHWDYTGVMTVEFFVHEGILLVNEIAPRVHNSGHWTIEGAATSQFENHLRAILDWPLGDTSVRARCVMYNVIGEMPEPASLLKVPDIHLHYYGKEPRPNRKLGHITLWGSTEENALAIENILGAYC